MQRSVQWAHDRVLLRSFPANLLPAKSVAQALFACALLIVFPCTILLPITLAHPVSQPAPGYIGRIVPVICALCLAQWLCMALIRRVCSFDVGFTSSASGLGAFSTESVWRQVRLACVQLQTNQLAITRESVRQQMESALHEGGFPIDLSYKLLASVGGGGGSQRPTGYFERKLLGLLFPTSPAELRRRHASQVCRPWPRARCWCWRSSAVWMVLFTVMVLIPVLILVPISVTLRDGRFPSFNNQTMPWLVIVPGNSSISNNNKNSSSSVVDVNELSASRFVLILIFSVFFPVCYVILVAADLARLGWAWWCRAGGCRGRIARVKTAVIARLSTGGAATTTDDDEVTTATTRAPQKRISSKHQQQHLPRTVHGLQLANELAAQADLDSAFNEVNAMFRFEWTSSSSSLTSSSSRRRHHHQPATSALPTVSSSSSSSLLPVFHAMAHFNKDSDTPSVRLIRARALAGQIRLGIFEFLRSPPQYLSSATIGVGTAQDDEDEEEEDEKSGGLRAVESAVLALLAIPHETVLLDADVVRSLFLYQVFRQVVPATATGAPEPIKSFEVWEQELTGAFDFANRLLFGFQMRSSSNGGVVVGGDLDEVEQTFCRLLFRLMLAPAFPRKKELEYLAWIGLGRVRLARAATTSYGGSEDDDDDDTTTTGKNNDDVDHVRAAAVLAMDELHDMLLVQERERIKTSTDAKRHRSFYTLVNHSQVKRSLFWLAMFKRSSQVEAMWRRHERYKAIKSVLPAETDMLRAAGEEIEAAVVALIVMETDQLQQPGGGAAAVAAQSAASDSRHHSPQTVSLFTSPLWDAVNVRLCVCEHVDWVSPAEEHWILALLAQTQALDLLFRFKQNKANADALAKMRTETTQFEARFPDCDADASSPRVAFLFMWIELHYHQSRVRDEYSKLVSGDVVAPKRNKRRRARGHHRTPRTTTTSTASASAATVAHQEDVFRRGFSYSHAAFASGSSNGNHLTAMYTSRVEKLHAQACAGLIEMHVRRGALDKAEEWETNMQAALPSQSIANSAQIQRALRHLGLARARAGLGRFWFAWYWVWAERPLVLLHLCCFWLLFLLPLVLGINLLSHSTISSSSSGGNDDDAFYCEWLGIVLPVYFVLFGGLRLTLVRRVRWFGEQEVREELEEAVADVLLAARAHVWQGGEYPEWELGGEHVTTGQSSSRHRLQQRPPVKRGSRLVLARAGLACVVFVVLPLVLVPPLLPLASTSAQLSAMWVILLGLPLCTLAWLTFRLVSDAVPRPVQHGLGALMVWLALFLVFPLVCGVPLVRNELLLSGRSNNGTAQLGCLWVWLVLGPGVCVCAMAYQAWKHRVACSAWAHALKWNQQSVEETLRFAFRFGSASALLLPALCLFLLLGARFSTTASSSSSLLIAVAVLQALSLVASACACASGVYLGWLRPAMASSSLLPVLYSSLTSFVIFQMAVTATMTTTTFSLWSLRRQLDVALWSTGLQFVCCAAYVWMALGDYAQRERFGGYFPEDWELFDPTARFVVERAKHVPFLRSEEAVRDELSRLRGPQQEEEEDEDETLKCTRRELEALLEQAYRDDAERRAEADRAANERVAELRRRYAGQRLAELVFTTTLAASTTTASEQHDEQQPAAHVNYSVCKWRYSLLQMSTSPLLVKAASSAVASAASHVVHFAQQQQHHRRRHRPHQASSSSSSSSEGGGRGDVELRAVNLVLGVISAWPLSSIESFGWVSEDCVVAAAADANWTTSGNIWLAKSAAQPQQHVLNMVEIVFAKSGRAHVLQFASRAARDDFVVALFRSTKTVKTRRRQGPAAAAIAAPVKWTHDMDANGMDRLRQQHHVGGRRRGGV